MNGANNRDIEERMQMKSVSRRNRKHHKRNSYERRISFKQKAKHSITTCIYKLIIHGNEIYVNDFPFCNQKSLLASLLRLDEDPFFFIDSDCSSSSLVSSWMPINLSTSCFG